MNKFSYDVPSAAPLKLRKAEKFYRGEILQYGLPVFPVNFKEEERADYRQLKHVNFPDLSLQLLLAGRFRVGVEGREIIMKPGELLIESMGSSLTIGNQPGFSSRRLIVSFRGTMLYEIAASLGLDSTAVVVPADFCRMRDTMFEIRDILSGDFDNALPELMAKGMALIGMAAEARQTLKRWLPDKIAYCYSFVICHLGDDISVDDVSSYAEMETPVLDREFKKYFGMTVTEMIRTERLKRAVALLKNTDHSIKEIARQCGYRNGKYFSDVFKKNYALSPKEYREKGAGSK